MSEEEECPLCMDPLDATDQAINYCQCGYRMCLWCWNQLMETAGKENLPGRCPNCRTEYDKDKITMAQLDPDVLHKEQQKKKETKRKAAPAGQQSRSSLKGLGQVRVVQRNLVYAVGMPLSICREEVLSDKNHFGAFGRIKKVSVNRSTPFSQAQKNGPSGSAYVTFYRPEDALRCIEAVDGSVWDGKTIKACFGTTKYCNAFLKGVPCNNLDCLYLHDIAEDGDSFSKEDMVANGLASGRSTFYDLVHPTHTQAASEQAHAAIGSSGSSSSSALPSSSSSSSTAAQAGVQGAAGSTGAAAACAAGAAARVATAPMAISGTRRPSQTSSPWGSVPGDGFAASPGPYMAAAAAAGAAATATAAAAAAGAAGPAGVGSSSGVHWGSAPKAVPPPLTSPLADVEWPSLGGSDGGAEATGSSKAAGHTAGGPSRSGQQPQQQQQQPGPALANGVKAANGLTTAAVVAGAAAGATAAAAGSANGPVQQSKQQQPQQHLKAAQAVQSKQTKAAKAGSKADAAAAGKGAKAAAADTAASTAAGVPVSATAAAAGQPTIPVKEGKAAAPAAPAAANGKLSKAEAKKAAKQAAKQQQLQEKLQQQQQENQQQDKQQPEKDKQQQDKQPTKQQDKQQQQQQDKQQPAIAAVASADSPAAMPPTPLQQQHSSPAVLAPAAAPPAAAMPPLGIAATAAASKPPPPGFAGAPKGPPPGFASPRHPPGSHPAAAAGLQPSLIALARAASSSSLGQLGMAAASRSSSPMAAAASTSSNTVSTGVARSNLAPAGYGVQPAGSAASSEAGSAAMPAAAPAASVGVDAGRSANPAAVVSSSSDGAAIAANHVTAALPGEHSTPDAAAAVKPGSGPNSIGSNDAFDVNAFIDAPSPYSAASAAAVNGVMPQGTPVATSLFGGVGSLLGGPGLDPVVAGLAGSPLAHAAGGPADISVATPPPGAAPRGAATGAPLSSRKQSRWGFAQQQPEPQQQQQQPPQFEQQQQEVPAAVQAPAPGLADIPGSLQQQQQQQQQQWSHVQQQQLLPAANGFGGLMQQQAPSTGPHAGWTPSGGAAAVTSFFRNLLPGVNVHVAASPQHAAPQADAAGGMHHLPRGAAAAAAVVPPNPGATLLQQLQRGQQQQQQWPGLTAP